MATIRMLDARNPDAAYRYLQRHLVRPLSQVLGCRIGGIGAYATAPCRHVHYLLASSTPALGTVDSVADPGLLLMLLGDDNPLTDWAGTLQIEPIRNQLAAAAYVADHWQQSAAVLATARQYLRRIRRAA